MERLTYRTELGVSIDKNEECPTCSICWNCDIPPRECQYISDVLEKLAKYEDLEEQGRLIKLPCKVGDVVYEINTDRNIVSALKIISTKIYSYAIYFDYQLIDGIYKNIVSFSDIDIGKTVFLTQSAAEEKLKELRGGENGTME